ncbi:hypothetical protein TrST_g6857 [Triparma strigata]|uniref:alpha-L-fucosidase n=1 Tax=Triparma strigata TaxID=1606541 RepID=A0A9W7EUC4_9STRA|nr:hypothetical protein TrST_g6857 [Triparma strigata]
MWPTNSSIVDADTGDSFRYNYSTAFTADGAHDIVSEFVEACEEGGIGAGLYLNIGMNMFMDIGANSDSHSIEPTGRFQACWDENGANQTLLPGQVKSTIDSYYDTFKEHLVELFGGRYGHDFVEVWLDGGYPEELGEFIADLIDKNQPKAVIFQAPNWDVSKHSGNSVRWAGTETGHTPEEDMWSTVSSSQQGEQGDYGYGPGVADGDVWMPAEQDAPIADGYDYGGFWYPGQDPKNLTELMSEYEDSVGHNSNFMLELSPDRDGAIPDSNLEAYTMFGEALDRCYRPGGVGVVASSDGFRCDSKIGCSIPISAATEVDRVRLSEADSTRSIRAYEILVGGDVVASGKSVGRCRIIRLPVMLKPDTEVMVRFTNATDVPVLKAIELLNLYGDDGCM